MLPPFLPSRELVCADQLGFDMVAPADLSCLKSEFLSLEKLIHELLHRQAQIASRLRLAGVELADDRLPPATDPSLGDAVPSTSWTTVPTSTKRLSLPLFPDPLGEDDSELLKLFNHYGPLQGLDEGEDEPPFPNSAASPTRLWYGSSSWTSVVQGGGAGTGPSSRRKRTSPSSGTSDSDSRTASPSRKRSRVAPSPPPSISPSPPLSSAATAASTANASCLLFPSPECILVGDSMVRAVAIPHGITYSFSGAKILDLLVHIPAIIERHPSAHTVIVHVGTNDIRCRQSIKLRDEYELLAVTIESLGKICIFSGLIPTLRRSSEMFSRLYSADQWLSNFCLACGYGYINHFDSFWNRIDLYKHDNLHPNNKGTTVLATNFSCHLSSLAD